MDAIEVKAIVEQALRDPRNAPWQMYLIVFILAALGAYFGSYIRRKGENLATKEDLTDLTEREERVRSQYAERLENLTHENRKILENTSREHQLRLAALDRRLEVHQEAFTLWRKLVLAMHSENLPSVVIECQTWWDSNCLYLDAQSREAFVRAFRAAHIHESLLHGRSQGQPAAKIIKENWDDIVSAGSAIVQGAALPPIKDLITEGILTKDDKVV